MVHQIIIRAKVNANVESFTFQDLGEANKKLIKLIQEDNGYKVIEFEQRVRNEYGLLLETTTRYYYKK